MHILKYIVLSLCLLVLACAAGRAKTWQVGSTRAYTAPSKVSALVKDGDTVLIDAGVYESDVTRWSANNLALIGVGGMAHLKANGTNYGGKAIWVIAGSNTLVENVMFSLCACPDHNGAGIRLEGPGLTVRHCAFVDNEDGILAGDNANSDVLIEYTEFSGNGYGDGYSHNLYINHVRSLTFRFNYSHHAKVGHELKSRAYTNYILYNRLSNEATGTASREIDLPNGGTSYIIGNEIEQGPNTQNSNIIGYGLEGLTNTTPHKLFLINNTVVNDRGTGSFVALQNGTELFKAVNNIFAGTGTRFTGTATTVDTSHNLYCTIAAAGFADPAGYNYRISSVASPAFNAGTNPGSDSAYTLAPVFEYQHPVGSAPRFRSYKDLGAHGLDIDGGVNDGHSIVQTTIIEFCPNPVRRTCRVSIRGVTGECQLRMYNAVGGQTGTLTIPEGRTVEIDRAGLPSGVLYYQLTNGKRLLGWGKLIAE